MIKVNEPDIVNFDLSYRLRKMKNPCFTLLELQTIVIISPARCPIKTGLGSKCSIVNVQTFHIERSKLIIADMRLIPLIM